MNKLQIDEILLRRRPLNYFRGKSLKRQSKPNKNQKQKKWICGESTAIFQYMLEYGSA